jgi:hypothetical protein
VGVTALLRQPLHHPAELKGAALKPELEALRQVSREANGASALLGRALITTWSNEGPYFQPFLALYAIPDLYRDGKLTLFVTPQAPSYGMARRSALEVSGLVASMFPSLTAQEAQDRAAPAHSAHRRNHHRHRHGGHLLRRAWSRSQTGQFPPGSTTLPGIIPGRQSSDARDLRESEQAESLEQFQTGAACFTNQYEAFTLGELTDPATGGPTHVNGALTLGENIADNGGIRAAHSAALPFFPKGKAFAGLTAEQQFFVAYGQSWCEAYGPDAAHSLLQYDPHAPAKARVNVTLSNFGRFAEAFSCTAAGPMVAVNAGEIW